MNMFLSSIYRQDRLGIAMILKLLCVIFLALLFCCSNRVEAQDIHVQIESAAQVLVRSGVDTTNLTAITNALNGSDLFLSSYAALYFGENQITGMISSIRTRALLDSTLEFRFLKSLSLLGDPDLTSLLYKYIDSTQARYLRDSTMDVVGGLSAIDLLLDLQDYSRFQFIQNVFERAGGAEICAPQLSRFALHGPASTKDQAYSMIINLVQRYPAFTFPTTLIECLDSLINKPQTFTTLMTIAANDSDLWARQSASSSLISNYKNNREVLNMLISRLQIAPQDHVEPQVYIDFLVVFPFPEVLVTLKSTFETSPDEFARDWARFAYKDYTPPIPDDSLSVIILIDSLISLKHQVATDNWVSDQSFVNELDSNLTTARNYLVALDSNDCARQIKIFQQEIDEEYRDSLNGDAKQVTIEGWKYLYYNAQYILARLPLPPTQFTLTLNVVGSGTVTKSPDLPLYDSATVVQLTASPGVGHSISWSGDASGNAISLSMSMNSNKSITATFSLNSYTITASAGANGGISPNGAVSVSYGNSRTFTITPNSCYRIDSVIVNGTYRGTMSSYTISNVRGDSTIRAVFGLITYTVIPTAGSNGSISPSNPTVVNCGSSQTFTITPNSGYRLDSLFIDGIYIGRYLSYTFTNITTPHSITAKFASTLTTITRSVTSNWNMLGVPVVVSNFLKTSVYPTAISSAFAFSTSQVYVQKDTLANGPGYWVKFPGQQSVTYSGPWLDSVTASVNAEWSIIGGPSEDILVSRIRQVNTSIVSAYFGYSSVDGYVPAETLKVGNGYWIKTNQAGSLVIGIQNPAPEPPDNPEQPPPPPGAPDPPILNLPLNGATNIAVGTGVFWYPSEIATSYQLLVSTSSSFSTLTYDSGPITTTSKQVPGLTYSTTYYWKVKATNQFGSSNWSSIWHFTTQAQPEPCQCCITSAISLDQFIIRDANGKQQHLYVRNGNRPLKLGFTDVDMPPKPIQGLFTARFHSNKFIETAPVGKSTKLQIDVGDAVGPVTLNWNILPENNIRYWLTKGKQKVELNGTGSMILTTSGNGNFIITPQTSQPPCDQ